MEVIIKEVKKLAVTLLVLDILITAVTLLAGRFDSSVLFGMLYGFIFVLLNFILLGMIVDKALDMDVKSAKRHMRINYAVRFVLLAVILVIPFLSPKINEWCVVLAMLSPKFTYFAIGFFDLLPRTWLKKKK